MHNYISSSTISTLSDGGYNLCSHRVCKLWFDMIITLIEAICFFVQYLLSHCLQIVGVWDLYDLYPVIGIYELFANIPSSYISQAQELGIVKTKKWPDSLKECNWYNKTVDSREHYWFVLFHFFHLFIIMWHHTFTQCATGIPDIFYYSI